MSCNVLTNFGFESGLTPWYPSTVGSSVNVGSAVPAYAGTNYVDILTNADTTTATVGQDLTGLDTSTPYNLTVQVRLLETISSVSGCTVFAYLGEDPEAGAIASDIIWTAQSWMRLTGTITPDSADTTLNLGGTCAFTAPGAKPEGHVLFDEVIFGDC